MDIRARYWHSNTSCEHMAKLCPTSSWPQSPKAGQACQTAPKARYRSGGLHSHVGYEHKFGRLTLRKAFHSADAINQLLATEASPSGPEYRDWGGPQASTAGTRLHSQTAASCLQEGPCRGPHRRKEGGTHPTPGPGTAGDPGTSPTTALWTLRQTRCRLRLYYRQWPLLNTRRSTMTHNTELTPILKRLKLSAMMDTLPERIALARREHLDYSSFLEISLTDEISRRENRRIELPASRRPAAWRTLIGTYLLDTRLVVYWTSFMVFELESISRSSSFLVRLPNSFSAITLSDWLTMFLGNNRFFLGV